MNNKVISKGKRLKAEQVLWDVRFGKWNMGCGACPVEPPMGGPLSAEFHRVKDVGCEVWDGGKAQRAERKTTLASLEM
ncbi:MAG: hypothetical protein HWN70_07520 [Desulfobacterales bacterium]|nr:hypothetical protein [Desulfobacterales bacterium]